MYTNGSSWSRASDQDGDDDDDGGGSGGGREQRDNDRGLIDAWKWTDCSLDETNVGHCVDERTTVFPRSQI